MAFQSKMSDLRPRRDKYKKEVTLVSGGFVNPKAFPGGKITVYPWDTEVDTWLQEKARSLPSAQANTILYRAVEKLANLNGCPLEDFLIGDVFTVLLVAKSILSDYYLEYAPECPSCGYKTIEKILIPDELGRIAKKTPEYPGYDKITLPVCKDEVTLRPLRIKDEFTITGRTPENRGPISDDVARILTPVVTINDGVSDDVMSLYTWYMALAPRDSKFLEDQEAALTPQLDLKLPHQCDKCKNVFDFILVLNYEFFRSGRFGKP